MKPNALIVGVSVLLLSAFATVSHAGPRPGRPDNSFQVRIGEFMPEGGGDLWADDAETFTLSVSDFDDLTVGFSFVTPFSDNLELGVNADFYDHRVLSSYIDYFDELGFPIFHDTELEIIPLTLDLRLLPGGRYRVRHDGRPALKPVPYVGAGLGVNFWSYEEYGDFIDFSDPALPIESWWFKDRGTAFETHVLAGVEMPLSPAFNLLLEGRYSWSDDTLGADFAGFGDIELSGLQISVGGSFRF